MQCTRPSLLSTSAMTSQSHSPPWRHNSNTRNVAASAREYDRNRFEIYGSALEHVFISLCTRANTWMLDSVYIKGNQMNFFFIKCCVFHCREYYKITIYSINENGGGDHKWRLSRVHYICTMHCVQCTLEKQCTAHHVINTVYELFRPYHTILTPLWTLKPLYNSKDHVKYYRICHIIRVCICILHIPWPRRNDT